MQSSIIKIENVNKRFGKQVALNNICLEFFKGDVCCILGENGAGKSTLGKVVAGVVPIDSGNIYIQNNQINKLTPTVASDFGINIAFQESYLFDNLTIAENILINHEFKKYQLYDYKKTIKAARCALDFLKIDIDVNRFVGELSVAEKKLIEIAKAFFNNPDVIILDEPTAPLGISDSENVFNAISHARDRGACVIYITHVIQDLAHISNKVIVMNNGSVVLQDKYASSYSHDSLVRAMVGDYYLNRYPKTKAAKGDVLLQASNLCSSKGTVKDVSFSLRSGEILGVAGLRGAGKSSISKLLFGLENLNSGTIEIEGQPVKIAKPIHAIRNGVAYLGDNTYNDVFPQLSLIENIIMLTYPHYSKFGLLNMKNVCIEAREAMHYFHMNMQNPNKMIKGQNAGTIQKCILCRWALFDSKVYILNDPTKNLDIPSKVEVYNLMNRMSHSGCGILFISSDISELMGMCDRILVMRNGQINIELDSDICTRKDVLDYSFGKGITF